ncbi:S8 family peptidase [Virgibacillus salexigens]|uniref:Thermostable alkaline protease n=1 Tax=Virgibacillus massiliensis TaxID=1462526 RepID=A0A024QHW1_9BACI|nr:S8 family peptidase [Virgibacillus massiliensis]CDQ41795.1 Thermostable alkaline protease precursor [Virgibacillus massiliensis]
MNKRIIISVFLSILFLVVNFQEVDAAVDGEGDQYFVTFKTEVNEGIITDHNGEIIKEYTISPSLLVELPKGSVEVIEEADEVVSVEPNVEVEISGYEDIDWGSIDIDPQEQLVPWNIDYIGSTAAHQLGISGKGIRVGIIDSGINPHKDLKVSGGINILDNSENYFDGYGHGTKVAGIIGALDNSYGLLGVASDADLYSIKVLKNDGKGLISDVVTGIEWAIENKMNIVNFSLQTNVETDILRKAIKKANENDILLVASSGNMGGTKKDDTVTYPAAYDEVISVAAINKNGERYVHSSTGKRIDISAPGELVYTTVQSGLYFLANGTSMSAPHVSGVAALVLQNNPKLNIEEIRKILVKSTKPLGNPHLYGKGLIDVQKAIKFSN